MYSVLNPSRNEIRLVRLLAGREADSINCELVATSLDRRNEFEALSYVWGSAKDKRPITIQRETRLVTKTLELALRHLRYRDRPRTLWVDAICINQDDSAEKSHQVRHMGEIYSIASQVLVWLGPGDKRDLKAITDIQRLAADSELHWFGAESDLSLLHIHLFLNKSWWSRIWTVQEAIHAKRITYHCGQWLLPGSAMLDMASSFTTHTSSRGCCDPVKNWGVKGGAYSHLDLKASIGRLLRLFSFQERVRRGDVLFEEAALEFHARFATDARDKVYGLLGISQGVSMESVDYSLTAVQVFEKTTREILDSRGTLDIISHCRNSGYSNPWTMMKGLPSWVPNWATGDVSTGGDAELMAYHIPFLDAYRACGQLRYTASGDFKEGCLNVSGIVCDRIDEVGDRVIQRIHYWNSEVISEWRSMMGIDNDPSRPYAAGDTVSEAFWRTLCLDIAVFSTIDENHVSKKDRAGPRDQSMHMRFWNREILRRQHHLPPSFARELSDIDVFQQHLMRTMTRRQFFISRKGYIGLGPLETKIGDEICVFAGGKMPFIVRNSQESRHGTGMSPTDTYQCCQLVGDAYVHGLMDGQAVEAYQKGNGKLESFRLL